MKAKIELELEPFMTPNFVRVKPATNRDIDLDRTSISIKDIDPETLDRLCDEFRSEIFRKAGKERPIKNAPG